MSHTTPPLSQPSPYYKTDGQYSTPSVGHDKKEDPTGSPLPLSSSSGTNDGWQFRPPYHGHIIRISEIIWRIVPYYEMFAINVFFLGWKVLDDAHQAVGGSTYRDVLYEACTDRWLIPDFDFCAASRLVWVLIGGAVIYFIITGLFAIAIYFELQKKGFQPAFTALWHSPLFIFCLLFPARKRVDVLSIPNKYIGLSMWTRAHLQRVAFAIYCFLCMVFVLNSLKRGTAESAKIKGENLVNGIKKYYNPYLVPYYVALYMFFKTLFGMLVEIIQDKDLRNSSERIGRFYLAMKSHRL